MATRIVPGSQQPLEERIQEEVPYDLYFVPDFPISTLGGRLDKDPDAMPWLQGLYDDIKAEGGFRNPVVVWNHHPNRLTGKQPAWLLRAGSNRVWCAEQLGWDTVPAVVSVVDTPACWNPPRTWVQVTPRQVQDLFTDGGKIWANDYGFGLLAAPKPEETYADAENRHLVATSDHKRTKFDPVGEILGKQGPTAP